MNNSLSPILLPEDLSEVLGIRSDVRIIDVRTPGEFESAHIRGAYNVPLDSLAEHSAEIKRVSEPVVLVCQSGRRAAQAETALKKAGFPNLHVLDGGLNAWTASHKPVVEGRKRLSLERQVRIVAGALAAVGAILSLTVHPWFAFIPAFIGSGLVFAGITDFCGMAMLLAKLPYNRGAACDIDAVVQALRSGLPPPSNVEGRAVGASTGAGSI